MKEKILEAIKQQDKVIEEMKETIRNFEESNKKIKEDLLRGDIKDHSEEELDKSLEVNIEKLKRENEKNKENVVSNMQKMLKTKTKTKEVAQKEGREIKLGLYIFNYIGVIFIFLGFISLAFLSSKYMNNLMKSITVYAFSFIFLLTGHFYFKRNKVIFSRGLLGCGIGLLYISTYVAHFVLLIFNKEVALAVSVLVTLFSIIITMYYKSISIAILSQVGGYLPVFSFLYVSNFSNKSLIISQIYVLLLNILMYVIYNKYHWKLLNIVSFALMSLWVLNFSFNKNEFIYINYLYILIYFAIYFLPNRFTKRENDEINKDIKIVSMVIMSFVSLSLLKFEKNVSNIVILLSQIILYIGLNVYSIKINENNKTIRTFLEVFANIWLLALGIIYLPFIYIEKYEYAFVFLNVIIIINIILYIKKLMNISMLISTIYTCYFYVMYFAIALFSFGTNMGNFEMKYKVMLLVLSLISLFIVKKSKTDFKYLKEVFIILLYFHIEYFLLSLVSFSIDKLNISIMGDFEKVWLNIIIVSIFTFITLFVKELKNYKLPFISFSMILVVTLFYNLLMPVPKGVNYEIRFILTLIANLLSNAISIYGVVTFVKDKRIKEQIVIFMVSGVLLLNGTIIAYSNIEFSYLNILLDVIYGLLSLSLIIIGFKRNFGSVRVVGLFTLIITTFKLMILDIPTTTLLSKMISFFIFGILSLVISYIYQIYSIKNKK